MATETRKLPDDIQEQLRVIFQKLKKEESGKFAISQQDQTVTLKIKENEILWII